VRVAAPLPVVRGPRSDLRAVITNIVENAVKYTPHGRSQTITIGADRSQAAPTIWVSDTGCGFDPQKIDDAFQAYVRCNAEVDGTGLGLAIVKKAVDGWGGKVWIDTERGVGTTVHFTAPGGSSHAGARSGSLWSARQEDLR
jgi:signal transduction histidine kinase